MSEVLIYREDLKVLVLKDGTLPQVKFTEVKQLRPWDHETLGFNVKQTGTKEGDTLVTMRGFGPLKIDAQWLDVEEAARKIGRTPEELSRLVNQDFDNWNRIDLDLINRVFRLFEGNGMDIYLSGGWAADFLAGSITRPHVDIDTYVWEKEQERIKRLLGEEGFLVKDKTNKYGVRKFQNELGGDIGFDCYFIPDTDEEKEKYKEAVTVKLNGVTAKVVNPREFAKDLKEKVKRSKKDAAELSGPLDKSLHDLELVQEYLRNH